MNRRNFLSGLVATVGGLYLPYEPERIYSFASSRYLKATDLVTKMMDNDLIFGKLLDKELYGKPIAPASVREEMLANQVAEVMNWNQAALDSMGRIIAHYKKHSTSWSALWDHHQILTVEPSGPVLFTKPGLYKPWQLDVDGKMADLTTPVAVDVRILTPYPYSR